MLLTTPGQRVGERPLGADHVVVQPADQGSGPGPGEEGDRHVSTWSKTARRRSRIRSSPMPGRQPALQQPEPGLDDRDHGDQRSRAAAPARTGRPAKITSTTRPASNGVATARTDPTTLSTQERDELTARGRANDHDAGERVASGRVASPRRRSSRVQRLFHACISMLMVSDARTSR